MDVLVHGRYTGHTPAIVMGEVEAHLIAVTGSEPPNGREHWTRPLLADTRVELSVVPHISDDTVRQTLKKPRSSRGSSSNGAFLPTRMPRV